MSHTSIDRYWESPRPRISWDDAATQIREQLDLRFEAQLPQSTLDAAITAAVGFAYPKTYQMELWRAELAVCPHMIPLPWHPEQVVWVGWKKVDEDNNAGETIPHHLWSVDQGEWRWLAADNKWPSWPVHWAMRAYGRPQTPAQSPTWCTVETQYLVPLVEAELTVALARNAGMPHFEAVPLARRLRAEAQATLPTKQRPAAINKPHNPSVSTVYFSSWGALNQTFADFV